MTDFKPHSHLPYGSDGSGFYGDNAVTHSVAIKEAKEMVMSALENIQYDVAGGAFTICDYGTADGMTSMSLFYDVIKWLKERYGSQQQVHVIYEDQPVNDFKSLFLRLHGLIPAPRSYYKDFDNVFITVSGTNFYSQCLPDNSVHLGFSSTAFQWLSKRPCELEDAILHMTCKNTDQVGAFAVQARLDWQTILLNRARELKSGGHLVLTCPFVDLDGSYTGHMTESSRSSVFEVMSSCWKEMRMEGTINQEEFDATSFNVYARSMGELTEPFKEGSPVYEARLRIVALERRMVPCQYNTDWTNCENKDDTETAYKHAKRFVAAIRTWSNYTFLSALDQNRAEVDKAAIVDEFYQKYEDRVAQAPHEHGVDIYNAYLHIIKL